MADASSQNPSSTSTMPGAFMPFDASHYLASYEEELKGIRTSIEAMSALVPEIAAAANRKLADHYTGPDSGLSGSHSQPSTPPEPKPQQPSEPPEPSKDLRQQLTQAGQQGLPQVLAGYKRGGVLGAATAGVGIATGLMGSSKGASTPAPPSPPSDGGSGGGGGGPQCPDGQHWDANQGKCVPDDPNPEDKSKGLGWIKREFEEHPLVKKLLPYTQGPVGAAVYSKLRSAPSQIMQEGQNFLQSGGGGSHALGSALGYPSDVNPFGNSDDLKIPGTGIGFRVPGQSAATWKGIQEKFEARKASFQAGLTNEQAWKVQQNLYQQGWQGGQQTNTMRHGLNELTKWNPAIGQSSLTSEAADKSLRMGQSSMKDFIGQMKQLPEVMKGTHVSFEQLMQDLDKIGEKNQEQGGTYAAGRQAGLDYSTLTGQPAGTMTPLMDNQYVQSRAFRQTGYLDFQQGLMTGGQRTQAAVGAAQEVYDTTMMPGHNRKMTGEAGELGGQYKTSSREERVATTAGLTGIPQALVDAWTDPKKRKSIMDASQIMDLTRGHRRDVHAAANQGRAGDLSELQSGDWAKGGKVSWGDEKKLMTDAIGPDGKKFFSKDDISDIEDAGKGGLFENPFKSKKERTKDHEDKRQKKIEEVLKKKMDDQSPGPNEEGRHIVELSKDAKKLFKLISPRGAAKQAASAGGSPLNAAFAAAATMIDPGG